MSRKKEYMIRLEWQVMNNNKQEQVVVIHLLVSVDLVVVVVASVDLMVSIDKVEVVSLVVVTSLKNSKSSLAEEVEDHHEEVVDNKPKEVKT